VIRSNPIKTGLKQGKSYIGTFAKIVDPSVVEIFSLSGFDYFVVDNEHSQMSKESMVNLLRASDISGIVPIVRVRENSRAQILQALDAGGRGVMVPETSTAEQVKHVVDSALYAPEGARGMIGVGPGTDFESGGDPRENLAFANAQIHVTIMLETREAFTHLNEIASVPGIDALTLGPSDLAQDLGVFGTPGQAEVLDEHRYRMTESALKHGKDVAMRVETVAQAKQWIEAGAKLLSYSSDVAVLKGGFRTAMSELRPR